MLSPELGQAAFRIAVFITVVSGVVLLFQTPGTAEFVISVAALAVGLIFMLIVIVLVKRSNR